MSVNQYGRDYGSVAYHVASDNMDTVIARSLSGQLQAMTGVLETLAYGVNSAQIYTSLSRRLQAARPEFKSDAEALNPVIALLAAQLLSIGAWNITYSDQAQTTSSPISWQTYGSGPRLPWEWATSAVIGGLLLSMLLGIVISFVYRMKPGQWLGPGGMLVAANRSPLIPKLIDHPDSEEHLECVRLFVVEGQKPGSAIISDNNIDNPWLNGHWAYTWLR